VCDANSGLINRAGGVVIDTQSDLAHARQMIEMFSKVWPAMPKRVINTHEDADHVWGNQLFEGAEIIAHRSVPERMKHVADPKESQKLLHGVGRLLTRLAIKTLHPGIVAAGQQLLEDYNFDGIELVPPRRVEEVLRRRTHFAGCRQAYRVWPLRRVACPGPALHERRTCIS